MIPDTNFLPSEASELRQQLHQQLEQLPDDQLPHLQTYLQSLSLQQVQQSPTSSNSEASDKSHSTGKSILETLSAIGKWQGDDFEECLQSVIDSRLPARFDYSSNPFE